MPRRSPVPAAHLMRWKGERTCKVARWLRFTGTWRRKVSVPGNHAHTGVTAGDICALANHTCAIDHRTRVISYRTCVISYRTCVISHRTCVISHRTCVIGNHTRVTSDRTDLIAYHTDVIRQSHLYDYALHQCDHDGPSVPDELFGGLRFTTFRLRNQRFPSFVTEIPVDLPSLRRNITRTVFTKFLERVLKPPARSAAAISVEFFGVSTVER